MKGQSTYVFGWLQGLSTVPDLSYTESSSPNTAAHRYGHIADQHDLFINSEGGIISGSVSSLNKFITPHSRLQSTSSSSSTSSLSTSSESSNPLLNEALNNSKKPTEVVFNPQKFHIFFFFILISVGFSLLILKI